MRISKDPADYRYAPPQRRTRLIGLVLARLCGLFPGPILIWMSARGDDPLVSAPVAVGAAVLWTVLAAVAVAEVVRAIRRHRSGSRFT